MTAVSIGNMVDKGTETVFTRGMEATNETTTTQTVTISGPNLRRPLCDKGDMHVHAAGCADLRKYPTEHDGSKGWTIEAASVRDIVEDVYGDQMHDYDPPAPWTNYENDLYFAPCVKLPREAQD